MDTTFYKENNWYVANCKEHPHQNNVPDKDGATWSLSGGLWYRNCSWPVSRDEFDSIYRIIHAPNYGGSTDNDMISYCNCLVYQVSNENTPIYAVASNGVVYVEPFAYKIHEGQQGARNKYLISYHSPNNTGYDRAEWNVVSIGKFQDHGNFLTEDAALDFANELLNRKIGKLNEQIIKNLNKLLKIQCPDCGYYPGERG